MKLVSFFLFLFLSLQGFGETTLVYRAVDSEEVVERSYRVSPQDGGTRFVFEDEDSRLELLCDDRYRTLSYRIESSEENYVLDARLEGRTIVINGTIDGEERRAEIPLDDSLPWYQTFDHQFADFALSGEKRRRFMMLRPDTMEMMEWQLKRLGEERIEIPLGEVEAVKVRISLTGIMAAFWSADCWYRKSDGRFLRYSGPKGGPGAEKLVSSLVLERLD